MKALTNSEVARQAGVNPTWLGRWLATGKLQRPKMATRGGHIIWLWTKADIERIRACKAKQRQTPSLVNHRPGFEAGDDQTV